MTEYVLEVGTSTGASNAGTFTFAAPATNYSLSALAPGSYFARLKGRNSSGNGPPSTDVTFTIVAVPGAPTNLAVSVAGSNANLTWLASTSGSTPVSYDVEIGTSSGSSSVGVFSTTTTNYSTTLAAGTYFARVKGKDASGAVGAASNEVTFTITVTLNVTGTWEGPTPEGTTVGFIISSNNITTLLLGGIYAGGSCRSITHLPGLSIPVTAAGFSRAATTIGDFTFTIEGTFASSTSASGTLQLTKTTPGCAGSFSGSWTANNLGVGAPFLPGPPSNFARMITGTSVTFTWTAPSSTVTGGADSYDVEIGTVSGGTDIGVFNTTSLNYTTTLPLGGPYFARVRARNASGTSPASTQLTFSIVELPGTPTGLASVVVDNVGTVQFTWTAPSSGGPVITYIVDIGTSSGATNVGASRQPIIRRRFHAFSSTRARFSPECARKTQGALEARRQNSPLRVLARH